MSTSISLPPDTKVAPPVPPEPAEQLGPTPQPARTVPALDIAAIYLWAKQVYEVIVLGMLITQPLTLEESQALAGGKLLFDAELERKVNQILTNEGADLFAPAVDVTARERQVSEIDALTFLRDNVNKLLLLINGTIAVRTDQQGRATNDLANAIQSLAQKGGAAALAASTTLQALQDRQAQVLANRKQRMDEANAAGGDAARAAVQNELTLANQSVQQLTAQVEALTKQLAQQQGGTVATAGSAGTSAAKGKGSHKGTAAGSAGGTVSVDAASTTANRRVPRR